METTVETRRAPAIAQEDSALDEKLKKIWESHPGFGGWLSTVDHKKLGRRYIITAFLFLLIGGVEALVMRAQLTQPNETLLSPEAYAQLFSMHGVTMIFLYAFPILTGFSVYLWPLILGARDMALPRLNAFSYWVYLLAGIFLYCSFPIGQAPDNGWFSYAPYSETAFNPGMNMDVYALGMVLLGLSNTVSATNFIVTLFRMRAPGMSINRVPILVWGTLTAAVANLFAVPAVSLAFFLLWLDRNFGTHFFNSTAGGQPLLWQHLFWMFGHPWVYVVVLPAMAFVSDGLPTFTRRPLVGYTAVALSTVLTMVLGFGVWAHHMFATGLPMLSLTFFSAASMIIVIPSAVAVFSWVATIWTGRPVFTTAFLYFAGFVLLFVIGGVSGFMTAAVPFDRQLTHTYFVVAHLHYVLIGINVFPVIGAVYYWFPKMTGRMMSERLGRWNFWITFIGFNLGFFPMHILGILGMPRRIYTYPAGLGWGSVNLVVTIGVGIFAFGLLLFIVNVLRSLKVGERAGPNPWDGATLEWGTASPPPPYNFAVIPEVTSRYPLWEDRLKEEPERTVMDEGYRLDHGRESIGTTVLDAEPDVILKMPEDSYAPLISSLAIAVLFFGLLTHSWWTAVAGGIIMIVSTVYWLWPQASLSQLQEVPHG